VHQLDEAILQLRVTPVCDALTLAHFFFAFRRFGLAFFIGFGFL